MKLTQLNGRGVSAPGQSKSIIMETFDNFRRRKFGGDLAASSTTFNFDQPDRVTASLLRQRLHAIYEMPADDLPDAFRVLLTRMSSKLERS